jgi:hypothetical protein
MSMIRNFSQLCLLIGVAVFLNGVIARAEESPHGKLAMDCQSCHVTTSWRELRDSLNFDHNSQTKFPLEGKHSVVRCIKCHTTLVFADAGTRCLDCHADIHRGQFDADCDACHTPQRWIDNPAMEKRHAATRFPLVGLHAKLDCQACHANGQYVNMPIDCGGCHLETYIATTNPNHADAGFSVNCAECHSITVPEWKHPQYTHSANFPLTGGHALGDCRLCHATGYLATSSACFSCHEADFNGTANPAHSNSDLYSHDCQICHTINGWTGAQLNHNLTAFPLTGAHIQTDCAQCHVSGYAGTPTDCYDCHRSSYESAENHVSQGFPQDCAVCHSTSTWSGANFNHSQTNFPLTGAHIETNCSQCHVGGQFSGTPTDCYACHELNYTQSTSPQHRPDLFVTACAECHSTAAWSPATFTIHDQTNYPLTGAHVQAECSQCHIGGQYAGTTTECYGCHQTDFEGTTDPNHVTENYPHDCSICHAITTWNESNFNHNLTTFPLTGAHIETNCAQCHAAGYTGTPTDCWSCHQSNYQSAEGHVQNNFPHDCTVCHSTSNWDANFNHSNTAFPLTGAHILTSCAQCHIGGVYAGTPTDCWSCHQSNYQSAEGHVQNNFPHDCMVCHNTSNWDANFNHSNTAFPLTGAHIQTNCAQCHVGGVYAGTPTDCWSCHQADYQGAEDHVQNNYPHDCTQCHNTNGWEDGGDFAHKNASFPLTGAHISVNCAGCHVGGQYAGTPSDCFFCHDTDYNDATPDHNVGYPQDCEECHTSANWNSSFHHDTQYFPIYSGNHRREWDLCSDCHLVPNSFTAFSCIGCHEHSNQNEVNNDHEGESGYSYTPTSCYECHQDGSNLRSRLPDPTPENKMNRKGDRR